MHAFVDTAYLSRSQGNQRWPVRDGRLWTQWLEIGCRYLLARTRLAAARNLFVAWIGLAMQAAAAETETVPWYAPLFGIGPGDKILGADYHQRSLHWDPGEQGGFTIRLQNRVQSRYVNPYDGDPRSLPALREDNADFLFRRVRSTLRGGTGVQGISYHVQYDWLDMFARDIALIYQHSDAFNIWVGRGKVRYNDERVVSSGRQQFVNRSIVSDSFTLDRQQGLQIYGRLFAGTAADMDYSVGVLSNQGIGSLSYKDTRPMLIATLRWHLLGEKMSNMQSDISHTKIPTVNFAFGGATFRSRCTRFVSLPESCLALENFPDPDGVEAGRFSIDQLMLEAKFRWQGFAAQTEIHFKSVTDRALSNDDPGRGTNLFGAYLQAGYTFQQPLAALPGDMETAVRYAIVNPDNPAGNDNQRELSLVINWFVDGHEHKWSAELSRLQLSDPVLQQSGTRYRLRLQWELRF